MSAGRLVCTMAALTLIVCGVTVATVKALPLELGALAQAGQPSRMVIRLAETAPADGLTFVGRGRRQAYLITAPVFASKKWMRSGTKASRILS